MDDPFVTLAEQISRDAAGVKCSVTEYRDGLRHIIEMLEADIRASEEGEKTDA